MGRKLLGRLVAAVILAGAAVPGRAAPPDANAQLLEDLDELKKVAQHFEKGDYVQAAATIRRVAEDSPMALALMSLQALRQLLTKLKDGGHVRAHEQLLEVLAGPSFAPIETLGSNDYFRLEYAAVLFENGNVDQAGELAVSLEAPGLLAKASLDPRYREFFQADFDVRPAAERRLARHRTLIDTTPRMLSPTVAAAGDLILLGRPQEAISVLRAVEARLSVADAFLDRAMQLNWWWNSLAVAYVHLGDYEAAVESFRTGANLPEPGTKANVSQLLNLAGAQVEFGEAEAALVTLSSFSEADSSAYGKTVHRATRGCAWAMTGRTEDAARDLAYLREHEKDSPRNLRRLLLCIGKLDDAAAVFIRHLEDPDLRAETLLDLSDYDAPVSPQAKNPVESNLPKLKERADVRAAIAGAGGIRRFRTQRLGI